MKINLGASLWATGGLFIIKNKIYYKIGERKGAEYIENPHVMIDNVAEQCSNNDNSSEKSVTYAGEISEIS